MKTLKESRSEFLRYLDNTYHPNLVYYPASGADKTPKQIFGEPRVIHLSLPENEAEAGYLERLGKGIKIMGDMEKSPLADRSVDLVLLNLQGIQLSSEMVEDYSRVLEDSGILAVEDRHVYDETAWNKLMAKLKTRFVAVVLNDRFSGKLQEWGVRPNKDYGGEQESCEMESVIVDSEAEMIKMISQSKTLTGFTDVIRYCVMKKAGPKTN